MNVQSFLLCTKRLDRREKTLDKLIFFLIVFRSNPKTRTECTAEEAYRETDVIIIEFIR